MNQNRKRACIVTHVGDCCLSGLWLRFYEEFWKDEVDKVYFRLNGHNMSQKIIDFYTEKFSSYPNFNFKVLPGNDHGVGLKEAVETCEEDYIMLMEDDAWVFQKGALDEQFKKLESGQYDLLGSPRVSLDMKVYEAQKKVQPELACTDKWGIGDTGTNFWPNFFFVTKEAIMKTDLKFWGQTWKKGDYIKEIDYTVEEDGAGADTGSWVCMQLRAVLPPEKIGLIPQYKAYPHDPILKENKQWTFEGKAKWLHAGSISSGVNRYLIITGTDSPMKDFFKPEDDRWHIELNDSELSAKDDMTMRAGFWLLCNTFGSQVWGSSLSEFTSAYGKSVMDFMSRAGLSPLEVGKRMDMYVELMGIQSWQQ